MFTRVGGTPYGRLTARRARRGRSTAIAGACTALCWAVLGLLALASPAAAHKAHVFERAFGSAGSGDGQLSLAAFILEHNEPVGSGLGINQESGDVYVADTDNHRIEQFSGQGAFIRAFGWGVADGKAELQSCSSSCRAGIEGSAPGQLGTPNFIAVDNSGGSSEGDVYVADSADNTVSKFSEEGALISSWGSEGQLHETPVLAEGTGDLSEGSATVSNLKTSSGSFEALQTLSGTGIAEGTRIQEVGSESLLLSEGVASKSGTAVALSARFVFGRPTGVTVDAAGNLWVYSEDGTGRAHMFEFTPEGALTRDWRGPISAKPLGIGIDSAESIFVTSGRGANELDAAGNLIGPIEESLATGSRVTGIAVDAPTGGLYVDHGIEGSPGIEVQRYGFPPCEPAKALCEPVESFGFGRLTEAQGLAAGPNESLYTADAGAEQIVAFKSVVVPDVVSGEASALSPSGAKVAGTINPDGLELSECFFEYGPSTEYGKQVPCAESTAQIGSGKAPVAVHATISGLDARFYHFRLVAVNENAAEHGADGAIGASVDATSVKSVSESGATLVGEVNPHGHGTSCAVQYVDEAGFSADQPNGFAHAESAPCEPANLGSGSVDQAVSATLTGLQPGRVYHYRFLSMTEGRTTEGPESIFVTLAPLVSSGCANEALRGENDSLGLPDCRAYEQVSPPGSAEVYVSYPPVFSEAGLSGAIAPTQAAASGRAVSYVGEGAATGDSTGNVGGGEGDEHIATRGEGGWSALDVQPLGAGPKTFYEGFSSDLSLGVIRTGAENELLPAGLQDNCIYSRGGGGAFGAFFSDGECGAPFFAGASEDGSALLIESSAAAVKGAQVAAGEGHENIYYRSGGELHLVNVLPGASPAADPDASVGTLSEEHAFNTLGVTVPPVNTAGAISADGSRVFWTDLSTGSVYERKNPAAPQSKISAGKCTTPTGACTVAVSSGAATYQAASADGHYAYYTQAGELWRYDSEGETREAIAPGAGAKVQGVVGASEDGSYVYFVAEGELAPGSQARKCQAASPVGTGPERKEAKEEAEGIAPGGRGCNLYVRHGSTTSLVAALLASDNEFVGNQEGSAHPERGVWRPLLGYHAAEPTPDGHSLTFMSERRLSAYDNVNRAGECGGAGQSHACSEVYVYDAQAERLACASCAPGGVAPGGAADIKGGSTFLPLAVSSITHTPRVISADGSRVFFDSAQPLLGSGSGGHEAVYEWEREGTGGCVKGSPFNDGGCVYLISGPTGNYPAYLSEIDESGQNAFFVTRAQLIPSDNDEKPDLYDARVGGGFPIPLTPVPGPCEGQARALLSLCPEQPAFGAVASESPAGDGNWQLKEERQKPKKELTRAQLLAKALKACHKRHPRKKRIACERRARKKFAPSHKPRRRHKAKAKRKRGRR